MATTTVTSAQTNVNNAQTALATAQKNLNNFLKTYTGATPAQRSSLAALQAQVATTQSVLTKTQATLATTQANAPQSQPTSAPVAAPVAPTPAPVAAPVAPAKPTAEQIAAYSAQLTAQADARAQALGYTNYAAQVAADQKATQLGYLNDQQLQAANQTAKAAGYTDAAAQRTADAAAVKKGYASDQALQAANQKTQQAAQAAAADKTAQAAGYANAAAQAAADADAQMQGFPNAAALKAQQAEDIAQSQGYATAADMKAAEAAQKATADKAAADAAAAQQAAAQKTAADAAAAATAKANTAAVAAAKLPAITDKTQGVQVGADGLKYMATADGWKQYSNPSAANYLPLTQLADAANQRTQQINQQTAAQQQADARAKADALAQQQAQVAAQQAAAQAQQQADARAKADALAAQQAQVQAQNQAAAAQAQQAKQEALAAASKTFADNLPKPGSAEFGYSVANGFEQTAPDGTVYRATPQVLNPDGSVAKEGQWYTSSDSGKTYSAVGADAKTAIPAVDFNNQVQQLSQANYGVKDQLALNERLATIQAQKDAAAATQAKLAAESKTFENSLPAPGSSDFGRYVANGFSAVAPDGTEYRATPNNNATGQAGGWYVTSDQGKTFYPLGQDPAKTSMSGQQFNNSVQAVSQNNYAITDAANTAARLAQAESQKDILTKASEAAVKFVDKNIPGGVKTLMTLYSLYNLDWQAIGDTVDNLTSGMSQSQVAQNLQDMYGVDPDTAYNITYEASDLVNSGGATAADLTNAGYDASTVNDAVNWDAVNVSDYTNAPVAPDILDTTNDVYGGAVSTPVVPPSDITTGTVPPLSDTAEILQPDNSIFSQPVAPTVDTSNMIPVTPDAAGNPQFLDPATGDVVNSAGEVVSPAPVAGPAEPPTAAAPAPYRVDVSGTAGFADNPNSVVNQYRSPNTDLASLDQINSGQATYNTAANAWEVPGAATAGPVAPVETALDTGTSAYDPGGSRYVSPVDITTPSLPEVAASAPGGLSPTDLALLGGGAAVIGALAGGGGGAAAAAPIAPAPAPVQPAPVQPVQTQVPAEPISVAPPAPVQPTALPPVETPITPAPVATAPVVETPVQPAPAPAPVQSAPVVETPVQPAPAPVVETPVVETPVAPPPAPPPVETPPVYEGLGIGEVPNPAEVPVTDLSTPPLPDGPMGPPAPPADNLPPVYDRAPDYINPNPTPDPTLGEAIRGLPIAGPLLTAAQIAAGWTIINGIATPPTPKKWGGYGPLDYTYDPGAGQALVNPGLNPGFIGPVKPFYQTTNPVQSQFYWGQHPYMATGADLANYNNIPQAPAVPWGAQQGYEPVDIQRFIAQNVNEYTQAASQGRAPIGPVAPT